LPRWRGAAPIHRAIEAGDAETGVTIMQMDAGPGHRRHAAGERVPIAPDDTTGTLHDKLAALGGAHDRGGPGARACGGLRAVKQPAEGVTYARKIDKAEAAIAWSHSAATIERRIRAFDPFPGATARIGAEAVKVWRARAMPGRGTVAPGTVVSLDDQGIGVACGDGSRLEITELQRAGGKRLLAADFLRGFPLEPGMRFEN
jgi:methionyl-tRNA formyltransferase